MQRIRQNRGRMKGKLRKLVSFTLRWGIAVVGIWWVISQMSFTDHAFVANEQNRPVEVRVLAALADGSYRIENPAGDKSDVRETALLNPPDRKKVIVETSGG